MKIKQVEYPTNTRKFEVEHKNNKYICYKNCFNGNSVFTDTHKNITDTKLGIEIILHCN